MDRAAGHYSQCLLSADASHARHGNPTKLENRQARCETRFERRTSRAFSRYGADECTSAELVAALADRTVTCAEGVATEAGGKAAASLLYVQNADGGTLTETTLTLTGVSLQTGWFTDRPYREAGRMTTAEFVALFSEEGANSFAEDPPNADLACEVNGEVVNHVVTLTDPVPNGNDLSYTVSLVPAAGDDDSFAGITCDADAHLFIDDTTATASACTQNTQNYDCYVGGFCAQLAIDWPEQPLNHPGGLNVYAGHTPSKKPASACLLSNGDVSENWSSGAAAAGPGGGAWVDSSGWWASIGWGGMRASWVALSCAWVASSGVPKPECSGGQDECAAACSATDWDNCIESSCLCSPEPEPEPKPEPEPEGEGEGENANDEGAPTECSGRQDECAAGCSGVLACVQRCVSAC